MISNLDKFASIYNIIELSFTSIAKELEHSIIRASDAQERIAKRFVQTGQSAGESITLTAETFAVRGLIPEAAQQV